MGIKRTLCGLVAMFFLGLAVSCNDNLSQKTLKENIAKETYQTVTLDQLKEKSPTYEGQRVEVKGYPLSVASTRGSGNKEYQAKLAIIIEDNQKILLASTKKGYDLEVTEAEALVQSEIDDGDYEQITIKGKYIENKLFIEEITANNHTLYFEKK